MKLILLSPSEQQDNEIPILLQMFTQGLPVYHVRKTGFSTRDLQTYLREIPEKYHPRIVIHTHHELAMKFNLKGIYISHSHRKRKIATALKLLWFKLRKRNLMVSRTFRSIENITHYNLLYDYVFLSPVFDSFSTNLRPGFSEQNLQYALKQTKYTVLACGGTTVESIQKVHELGFSGAVFYSAIWKTKNPLEAFKKVKAKFEELNLLME
jgi:thiamine-phosphate pyrophosphorylase